MSWFLAFAGFSALIILHEAGHFVAAKATGMRVERFSLFFPPYLARKRRGETEYCVGLVPLGGFVKITGMNPEEELPPEVAPRAYYHQPVWKRIVVIGAGPAVNILIAFVLLFFLAFDFAKAEPRVADITPRSAAAETLRPGDRIISVDGVRSEDPTRLAQADLEPPLRGQPRAGCRATTPAVLRIERDGRVVTVRVRPRYNAAAEKHGDRLLLREQTAESERSGGRRPRARHDVGSHLGHGRQPSCRSSIPTSGTRSREWSAATR